MTDNNDEGTNVFPLDADALRAQAEADGAEAATEAQDRDATGWRLHVESAETATAHNQMLALRMAKQADVFDALADAVRVATLWGALYAAKRLIRGRA